ncbi:CBS domain-containing protein [Salinactinospora qingdaonensis]|uniref:CBS domain-containing protein n=1 Tax=Salinactinospora qingdaonensis TaxID=702744 RepID=A0ABP7GD24_9ACTN
MKTQQSEITAAHPVHAIMTTSIFTVDGGDPLRSVAAAMTHHRIGALVVIEEEAPTGIISERDVVDALAEGGDPDEVWAADMIGTHTLWADPEDSVLHVARLMRGAEVRHIPVSHEGELVGIVSLRDVLDVLTAAAES